MHILCMESMEIGNFFIERKQRLERSDAGVQPERAGVVWGFSQRRAIEAYHTDSLHTKGPSEASMGDWGVSPRKEVSFKGKDICC
jgi:hypothetical protein